MHNIKQMVDNYRGNKSIYLIRNLYYYTVIDSFIRILLLQIYALRRFLLRIILHCQNDRIDFSLIFFLQFLLIMMMMNSTFLLHQQRHFATSILTNRLRTLCRKAYSVPYAFKSVVLCNNSKALSRTMSTNSSSRNQNLYGILNVSKTATQKEIKLAYFREVRMKK